MFLPRDRIAVVRLSLHGFVTVTIAAAPRDAHDATPPMSRAVRTRLDPRIG